MGFLKNMYKRNTLKEIMPLNSVKNIIALSKGELDIGLSSTVLEKLKVREPGMALELKSSFCTINKDNEKNEAQCNKFTIKLHDAGDISLQYKDSPTYEICAKAIDMLDANQSLNKEMLIGDFISSYLAEHKTEIDELCVGQNIVHSEL